MASVSSCKMFVPSPLHFIENLSSDLLLTIAEITEPPRINVDNSLTKVLSFLIIRSSVNFSKHDLFILLL